MEISVHTKMLFFQLRNCMFLRKLLQSIKLLFPLCRRASDLAIVLCCFHFEDVGDDAVNGDVSDEPGKEQFLGDAGAHQPQRGQAHQDPGQPAREGRGVRNTSSGSKYRG